MTCAHCGLVCWTWREGRYCSRTCAAAAQRKPKLVRIPQDQRSPLRIAYEDGDAATFFLLVKERAEVSGGCWSWRNLRDGYPYFRVAGKDVALHRAVLELKHGAPLGSQHAHHVCANAACVNPDHLQPVTHRENVAEMLARQSYLARIAELEAALASIAPDHYLLAVVAVA